MCCFQDTRDGRTMPWVNFGSVAFKTQETVAPCRGSMAAVLRALGFAPVCSSSCFVPGACQSQVASPGCIPRASPWCLSSNRSSCCFPRAAPADTDEEP